MGTRHDVVVVGARCAGAATALLLARLGHDVAVIDRTDFPSDTLSTHGISRDGVVLLERWGLLDDVLTSGAPALRTVRLTAPDRDPLDLPVKPLAGVDLLVAPRRYVLDTLLLEAAVAAGARHYPVSSVTDLTRDPAGRVSGVRLRPRRGPDREIAAEWVVGADGRRSGVAREAGAQVLSSTVSPSAASFCYVDDLGATGNEFHVAPGAYVGVFPTHWGQACVWLCAPAAAPRPRPREGSAALLQHIGRLAPDLGARLSGCRAGRVHHAARLPDHLTTAVGPGWALAGDAACHRDPITGHGMSEAFRDADLLVAALHERLAGGADDNDLVQTYDLPRAAACRDFLELSGAMSAYPPTAEFIALQQRLGAAIDQQAIELAARPSPGGGQLLAA